MVNPVDMLYEEHRHILKVVDGLKCIRQALDEGWTPDRELLREIVSFMREFADHCHHAKEEDLLFPALIDHGVPEGGCPIGGLLGEHGRGRKLVSQLAEAIDTYDTEPDAARDAMKQSLDGIIRLYPDHIWKEDEMVFPMVARLFSEAELAELQAGFDRVESDKGHDHQHFIRFAAGLEARLPALGG